MLAPIRFISLLTSLLAGTMFGIWLGFSTALGAWPISRCSRTPFVHSMSLYRSSGLVCTVLTAALAVLTKHDQRTQRHLLWRRSSAWLRRAPSRGSPTRPINAVLITWSPQAPAASQAELRDIWRYWRGLRTIAGVAARWPSLLAAIGAHRQSE